MRTRIDITFTPGTRSITTGITDLTIDDIRLFINESQMKVICSSMQKDNVVSISSGVVTYKDTFPVLAIGDHITFEIDKGDDVAKKSDIPTVQQIQNGLATESNATTNKEAIIAAIPTIPTDYAKDTSVKQGNDTAIGMLKDATNGLAAIKSAIPSVANIQNGLAQESSVKDGNDTAIAVAKAIQDAVGSAPSGSEITTLFAWLTTIYEYLAGQTPEEIPEGLGDRINLLLQFFGLPQALPEYQSMTEQEGRAINDDLWEVFYGFNTAKVKIHIKISENEDFASYVWLDTSKTYGDYYSELYDAEGNSVLTDNPEETDPVTELYTYIVE